VPPAWAPPATSQPLVRHWLLLLLLRAAACPRLTEPARGFSVLALTRGGAPPPGETRPYGK
jgi:hypothetical protein